MKKRNEDYTPKQLEDATTLITLLGRASEDERRTAIIATNAFMIGMRAASILKGTSKTEEAGGMKH